ncbi:hypothetical protein [Psychrobacter sp. FDAARGOS_221]|uniref:hypothetical protein n=1 Tax=Psychrobacter sp. FDAARGOS_221 TaxID=1975705 RepID=UPI000BB55B20|nr:hypothetical protein [Psychrobacter sp. FDAARGOS_221]PNK61193.1 hypothetical protein A6J60_010135 [Psychrobacter sp. FDAARGOS_221]
MAQSAYLNKIIAYIKAHPFKVTFVILWAIAVYQIIMAGYIPDHYAIHFMDQPDTDYYPINLVMKMNAIMLLQITLLAVADRFMLSRYKYLVMLVITFVLLGFFGPRLLHAPPPLAHLILWLLVSFGYLLLTCCSQLAQHFDNQTES